MDFAWLYADSFGMEAWYSWQCLKRQWQTQVVHVVKQPGINLWRARGHFAIHHSHISSLAWCFLLQDIRANQSSKCTVPFSSVMWLYNRIWFSLRLPSGWRLASQARTENQQVFNLTITMSCYAIHIPWTSCNSDIDRIWPNMPIQACSKHPSLQNTYFEYLWVEQKIASFMSAFFLARFLCTKNCDATVVAVQCHKERPDELQTQPWSHAYVSRDWAELSFNFRESYQFNASWLYIYNIHKWALIW